MHWSAPVYLQTYWCYPQPGLQCALVATADLHEVLKLFCWGTAMSMLWAVWIRLSYLQTHWCYLHPGLQCALVATAVLHEVLLLFCWVTAISILWAVWTRLSFSNHMLVLQKVQLSLLQYKMNLQKLTIRVYLLMPLNMTAYSSVDIEIDHQGRKLIHNSMW